MQIRQWIVFPVTLCAAIAVVVGSPPPLSAGDLSVVEFQRLHEQLKPPDGKPWRSIPWKIRLLDAQQTAAKEQKPIFIWAMDGHPLGCT